MRISSSTEAGAPPQQLRHSLLQKIFRARPRPIPSTRTENPKVKASILGRISWCWLDELFKTGYWRVLEPNDIWKINPKESIEPLMEDFHMELDRLRRRRIPNMYWRAILYAIRWKFTLACVVTLSTFGTEIALPVLSRPTIQAIQNIYNGQTQDRGQIIGYAVGNTLLMLVWIYLQLWSAYYFTYVGQVMRGLVIAVIFEKTLKLSAYGSSEHPPSVITSYISTDTNRIYAASRWTAQTLSAIPAAGAIIGILVHYIGVAAFPGLGLILLGCAATLVSSKYISAYRSRSLPFADKRISCVTETIEHIKILKFYGWESSYVKRISEFRRQEEKLLIKNGLVESINSSIISCVPYFAGLIAFVVRSITNKSMDPSRIFPALTLFLTFQPIIQYFSDGVNSHADAYTSYKRLQTFFAADEEQRQAPYCKDPKDAIKIVNGKFGWTKPAEPNSSTGPESRICNLLKFSKSTKPPPATGATSEVVIRCDRLRISEGQLVMVVGATGSGKSSLLSAINGKMPILEGTVYRTGDTSTSMDNWTTSGTIRENILFGKEMDSMLYNRVLAACELSADISHLPRGDLTMVGERGITLSGGQRARLALARASYHAQDIVLLDDVLAALDPRVGRHVFEHCIQGLLGGCTRVMSTHDPRLLKYADSIVYMHDSVASVGTLSKFSAKPGFQKLLAQKQDYEKHRELSEEPKDNVASVEVSPVEAPTEQDDHRARGRMEWNVLLTWLRKGSWYYMFPTILICMILVGGSRVMQSVFLSWWTADAYSKSRGWYIGVYAAIIGAICSATILLELCLSYFCLRASSGLHKAAIENVYRASMEYFNTTPLGYITTRLTDDIAQLDMMIYILMRISFPSIVTVLAMLVTLFVYLPWTALCILPIAIFTIFTIYYYRISSREVTRIASLFRSKMFSHITETMGGIDIIRSTGESFQYKKRLYDLIDDFNSASFINTATQFWLGLRIMLSTLPVTFLVTMLCGFRVFDLNSSSVAMLLSLLSTICVTWASTVVMLVELEKEMNSVERVYELGYKIPQETALTSQLPPGWPTHGAINFYRVSMQYSPSSPLVLKSFSLDIAPGEKVAICGRTGAGKSTLLSCLFRLVDLQDGTISIDGIDTCLVNLHDLRARIGIIPQDPVLFAGTIRSNLDPFDEHTDEYLWDIINRSGIKDLDAVADKFHLDSPVDAKGSNFSQGHRQLIALARALVRDTRIIALDEATSNVDRQTDAQIQRTLAKHYGHATMICIAHRLDTILHYDRIVVMDKGEIAEVGTTAQLYRQNGIFTSLCRESGINLEQRYSQKYSFAPRSSSKPAHHQGPHRQLKRSRAGAFQQRTSSLS